MERETNTLQCPSGKPFVIKTYLTPGERRQIRNLYADALKQAPEAGEKPQLEGLGETISKAEDKLIELSIVSYDGSSDGILDRLLNGNPQDGTLEDYDFVLAEANKLNDAFTRAK